MEKAKLGLEKFPLKTFDKIRYNDTDRQGHVNNAAFSTFLETGRVEVLYNPEFPILSDGASFVIAALRLNFKREIKWPGQVEIGTGLRKIGNSSMVLYQALFQQNECVADAETVIVQVDDKTGASQPLSVEARTTLINWVLRE
ncbi:MAG TPA: thioesterase [Bacteroidetes bacterium]|nr:thioesterase [Bacteroidota bacterium]HRR09639.1 thioesterase family protein [Rhodothermales bacterium]